MKTTREKIIQYIKDNGPITVTDVVDEVKPDNQPYISLLLKQLREAEKVIAVKEGRHVYYSVPVEIVGLEKNLNLLEVEENQIWKEVIQNADFMQGVDEKAISILYFAFSKILKNAVDYSRSKIGYAKIWRDEKNVYFIVKDKGAGIFRSFMNKKNLEDEQFAIQSFVKEKQSTGTKHYSDERLFWVLKIADKISLSSYDYSLIIDNCLEDYTIIKSKNFTPGTKVEFSLDLKTKKSLAELFAKYSLKGTTHSSNTTKVPVKLFDTGEAWISRSQAKRILEGLEQYKKITLDFKGVKVVGQGFADEIFQVFSIAHPEIEIELINMEKSVELIMQRAKIEQEENKIQY